MAIETKKEQIFGSNGKVIAVIPHCVGDKGTCRRDSQRTCECNIFSGNPELPNRFEAI